MVAGESPCTADPHSVQLMKHAAAAASSHTAMPLRKYAERWVKSADEVLKVLDLCAPHLSADLLEMRDRLRRDRDATARLLGEPPKDVS